MVGDSSKGYYERSELHLDPSSANKFLDFQIILTGMVSDVFQLTCIVVAIINYTNIQPNVWFMPTYIVVIIITRA